MFTIGTVLPPPPTSRWPQPEGEEAGTTCAEKAARCGEVILAGEPFGFDNGSAEAGRRGRAGLHKGPHATPPAISLEKMTLVFGQYVLLPSRAMCRMGRALAKPIKNFCGACRQKINLVWRTTCLVGIGEQVIAPTAQVPAELSVPPQYRRNSPTILPWMRTRLGGRMRTS